MVGGRDQSISNNDNEIKEYLSQIANKIKYKFKARKDRTCYNLSINNKQGKNNVIRDALKYYNLINNKHIPKEFLINSKEKRLYLLAGLIDSDGYHAKSGICQIVSINKKLADGITFLCRSLGFQTSLTLIKKRATNSKNNENHLYYQISYLIIH